MSSIYGRPQSCAPASRNASRPPSQGVVVDLAPLQFCDSTGLRALAGAAKEARVAANRLVMLRPSNQGVCRAFELAGAAEFLPLVDDVDQARKLLMAP